MKKLLFPLLALIASVALAQQANQVGAPAGTGIRYATDAYPGFDPDKETLSPERKTPRWFSFINGPKGSTAEAQYGYCQGLEQEGRWSKAIKGYDALVREWPASEEAPKAQLRMAELLLEKEDDCDEAFAAYRYLVDFYSFRCDYNAVVDRMYAIVGRMREEGKTVLFFRFRNTVEVRRAYECCVLRAPGAKWTPAAMLAIGVLREDEGKSVEAIRVYENLRNLHQGTAEAKVALLREASVRMRLLDERGYNRERCQDTIRFLEMAVKSSGGESTDALNGLLARARAFIEEEDYRAACFYDTKMRTPRSAINAYERFLSEYPDSFHAEQVRARLNELKGSEK